MAAASDSTVTPELHGPVTAAMRAIRTEPEPARRNILVTAAAALAGTIIGWPTYKGTGPDLGFVAECWLRDAADAGMIFHLGPDGAVWHTTPYGDGEHRADQRARLKHQLNARPRLQRAVYAKVEGGFFA